MHLLPHSRRNLSRAIIIKFQPIEKIYKGREKVELFRELHQAERESSSSIGQLICLGNRIFSSSMEEDNMYETINAEVSDLLDGSLIRMAETYSVWLYATIKVSMVIATYCNGKNQYWYENCKVCLMKSVTCSYMDVLAIWLQ